MKIDPSESSIVIAGSWNVAIFTPVFVAKNIFTGPESFQPEMTFGPAGLRPHYVGSRFELFIDSNKVTFRPRDLEDKSLQHLEDSACNLLGLLAITPITGAGINFSFSVQRAEGPLREVLDLRDTTAIAKSLGGIRSIEIRREIPVDDGITLNFLIRQHADQSIALNFNFHHDVVDARDAAQRIRNHSVALKQRAIESLRTWYGLELGGHE